MSNFYIAFAVYLNLIFVAAKLWEKVDWAWVWVMTPLIWRTVIGLVTSGGQATRKKRIRGNLVQNIQSLRDLVESAKSGKEGRH